MKKKIPVLDRHLQICQKKIGIRFKNPKHLAAALTHTSMFNQNKMKGVPAFERLEFFGDAVLNLAICEKIFWTFPNANEGLLSRFRSTLVSKKILCLIAKKLSIHKFVIMTPLENENKLHLDSKLFSDVLEALIGAIYVDRGLKDARAFVWKHWKPYFNEKKIVKLDPNPKSTLQEVVQKIFHVLPVYQTSPAKIGFSAKVSIGRKFSAKGTGISKQNAEASAAEALLKKLIARKTYTSFFKKAK